MTASNFALPYLHEDQLKTMVSKEKSPETSIKKQIQSISPRAATTISVRKNKVQAADGQALKFKKELQKESTKNLSKSPKTKAQLPHDLNTDINCENISINQVKGK